MGANPWFMPIGRHRYAEHVLFCFHHAGGNAAFYQSWAKGLPESLSLVAIQFPGRSGRLNESPVVSMSAAVSEIASGIPAATLGLPFSFFGHSLGALVAFEVARVYEPRHLFVSGLRAPQVYERTRKHNNFPKLR